MAPLPTVSSFGVFLLLVSHLGDSLNPPASIKAYESPQTPYIPDAQTVAEKGWNIAQEQEQVTSKLIKLKWYMKVFRFEVRLP